MTLHLPAAFPPDTPLLVGYSGGADSRLLLHLTKAYGDAHGAPVYAAHLHHGIRGEEADRDLAFCRRTAQALGVPLFEKRVDVPALAVLSGQSPEAEARRQRYQFFREVMETHRIPLLLTAHHADDQLETLLLRFLRGSGTKGMGGIPPIRPLDYGTAYRPLLSYTKAEILEACRELGLDYVTDSTNLEGFTPRNRLRSEVIPALEALVGDGVPQQMALRLSHAAREDDDHLTALAEARVNDHGTPDGGLALNGLQGHAPAITKRMIALLYERATAETDPRDGSGTLSAAHLEALCDLASKGTPEASVTLPRGMEARVRGAALYILPLSEDPPPAEPLPLYEGEIPWDQGRMTLRLERLKAPCSPLEGDRVIASAVFPAKALPLPLWARPRTAGDVILSHGMHKKLKKLLCDKGIPPHMRSRLPLICYGTERTPLWYPTVAFADGFPSPDEGPALRITLFGGSAAHVKFDH